MTINGEARAFEFGRGQFEESAAGAQHATKPDDGDESDKWPWRLTVPCRRVLNRARTFALISRSPETNGEHLLAMLAQDEAGQGEMGGRGFQAEAAFRAAYLAVMSKSRLTHDNSSAGPGVSEDLRSLMQEAEAIAQGFEASPRAVSTADVVVAIARRPDTDPIKSLMSAKVTLTPAEEARDGIRSLERLLTEQVRGILAVVRNELKEVHQLAAKTANDNDLRWGRAKKAMLAMAGLVVLTGAWISFDGGRSVRLALAWLSRMIT